MLSFCTHPEDHVSTRTTEKTSIVLLVANEDTSTLHYGHLQLDDTYYTLFSYQSSSQMCCPMPYSVDTTDPITNNSSRSKDIL